MRDHELQILKEIATTAVQDTCIRLLKKLGQRKRRRKCRKRRQTKRVYVANSKLKVNYEGRKECCDIGAELVIYHKGKEILRKHGRFCGQWRWIRPAIEQAYKLGLEDRKRGKHG